MIKSLHLMSIGGVEVRLDWSLLIVVALVGTSLGGGLLPQWHPEWSPTTIWATALSAAVLLIASVLLHELAHALVGRRNGIDIKRITLFVFGGMAHLEAEPQTWRAELKMAIVGPLVSLVLGGVCVALATLALPDEATFRAAPLEAIGELGPGATLMLWLGPVNVVLALFNLVPAFPLDGGRVARALLWGARGDLVQATRWAATFGQLFAWLMISAGVAMTLGINVPFFGTGLGGGLWLALIGWFLHNAAVASARQAELGEALAGVRVRQLMKTDFVTVPPDLPLQALVDDYLMAREQRCYPVVEHDRLAGLVCLDDLRRSDRAAWSASRARDVMTPVARLVTTSTETPAAEALKILTSRGINQLPVVERGEIKGLVSREDVLKWMTFVRPAGRSNPAESD